MELGLQWSYAEQLMCHCVYTSVVYSPVVLDAAKAEKPANVIIGFKMLSQTVAIFLTLDVENLTLAFAPGRLAVLVL